MNVAADYASIAILRGPHLIFFRNRAADTDGTLADLVHQTAMYYEDRLQGAGFARVLLAGAAGGGGRRPATSSSSAAASRSGCRTPVETVDPRGGGGADRSDRGGAGAARHAGAARRPAAARPHGGAGVIRTNLSTRPFYNERAVHLWLLAGRARGRRPRRLFNVSRVLRYSRSDTAAGDAGVARRSARGRPARSRPRSLRASVDPRQIEFASADARQANDLIDRRTFSWTELFNRFETTLPDDVRITSVRPQVDRERGIVLTINVVAREASTTSNEFMENLEATGAFSARPRSTEERINEDRACSQSTLETIYTPAAGEAGAAAPAAARSGAR